MLGRLLRGVQPELMDALIQASKDGDQSRLQALSGLDTRVVEEDGEEDEADEEDYEEEDEVHYSHFIYYCLLIISKSASWRLHR